MKKIAEIFSWSSLKGKILTAFIITAVIPSFILMLFSYINTSRIVRDNVEEMMQSNLQQTKGSMDIWMNSYEDILAQICTNDDIVDMVDNINQGKDVELEYGRLRRNLRGMLYTKEHIKCITIVTEGGHVIFYDLLTGSSTTTSWMQNVGMSQDALLDYFSMDNGAHLLSTQKAGVYASKTYYLFHLGRRIIDHQDVDKQLGVVIVSIDEEMLQEICAVDDSENNFKFIVDTKGTMISCTNKNLLATKVIDWTDTIDERQKGYEDYVKESGLVSDQKAVVEVITEDGFGNDIVSVFSQKELVTRLNTQQRIMLTVLAVTVFIMLIFVFLMTRNLMDSINSLVKTMKAAGKGKLSVRRELDKKTPTEIQIIETQFNHMMNELEESMKKEKEAIDLQRKAEIAALEAQINPHFLYNTLDTINWMAIDHDEYEISHSITSLASILRYGIDNSNVMVKISQEMKWLKQYLYLQQTRLKNMFRCEIHVSQEVQEWKIHKLLIQPFVENAIYHGFKMEKDVHILRVEMEPCEEKLMIQIWDNGAGMSRELTDMINQGIYPESEDRNCIGMKNATDRIRMYYGEDTEVKVDSEIGEYTSIRIFIPKITE